MDGLFGTLTLGTRSLQAQRAGVEIAGQNLANVNNPAYARQRVVLQTSLTVNTTLGPQGTGVDAIAIQQIRDALVDQQVTGERSVGGYLEAQQNALQYAQAGLGEFIDRSADTSAAGTPGAQTGLADDLSNLFNAFQSVSASPTSLTERQVLLARAGDLASQLNQTSTRLAELHASLDRSLGQDVSAANRLLTEIADLNDRVVNTETSSGGIANDLRDLRQAKLEELSKLARVDATLADNGALNISLNGHSLVSDKNVLDTLETFDAGSGQMRVRLSTTGTPLNLSGGHMLGIIDVRDGALASLRSNLDQLAGTLITAVNATHASGFALNGSTGAAFFTGTDAATIRVNTALLEDPARVQLGGVAGNPGDNTVGLALAQLAEQNHAALGNQSFSQHYSGIVAELGQALASNNGRMADHDVVQQMLLRQREALSGVSIDEEMTDLVKFQKAFEASARLITTIDEMLDTLLNM